MQIHSDLPRFIQIQPDSDSPTQIHSDSLSFPEIHPDPHRFAQTHLDYIDKPWREKGNGPETKREKGRGLDPDST